jgi:hypothetical protein
MDYLLRAALAALLVCASLASQAQGIERARGLTATAIVQALGYTPGRGNWFTGTDAPLNGVGQNGDNYFRTDTGQIYLKSSGAWAVVTTLPALAATNTWTGFQVWKGFGETYSAPAIAAGVLTIDLTAGTFFNVSNNANISTFAITGAPAGKVSSFTLALKGNGTAYTQSWGVSVKWANGAAPVLTSDNNKVDLLAFVTNDGGTTWFGLIAGQFF